MQLGEQVHFNTKKWINHTGSSRDDHVPHVTFFPSLSIFYKKAKDKPENPAKYLKKYC
jgi:hypothetical protein